VARVSKRRLRILRFRVGATVDQVVRAERLREVAPDPVLGVGARVFIVDPDLPPNPPTWVPFLEAMTTAPLPEMAAPLNGAIVFLSRSDRLWALTFGTGHLFVDEDRAESRFGLKTVLNLVDVEQLRSIGSRAYEDVVVRTLRQVSRRTTRDAFTIDDTRDILREVTGAPRSQDSWGTEITGGTALSLSIPIEATELPDVLDRIAIEHGRDTYKAGFAFVDFIQPVTAPGVLADLDADAMDAILGRKRSDIYLAPPEPILYEDVAGFRFYREHPPEIHEELDLVDYRRRVDPATLTLDDVHSHAVRLISASTGTETRSWSVYRCLVYETTSAGRSYLLSEGEWFEIDASFVARVDREIGAIRPGRVHLPPAIRGETERAYNTRAARLANLAFMDFKLVPVGGTTIEVADLISSDGEFIHIKRKAQSATLSHLFAQGRISAETMKADAGARAAAIAHLDAARRAERAVLADPYDMRGKTVVFGVIAENAAELPSKLPFFSRLNLWQARRFLAGTLDYDVAFVGIPFA
jgi:uncharacterized protein (TIGR04141 family)